MGVLKIVKFQIRVQFRVRLGIELGLGSVLLLKTLKRLIFNRIQLKVNQLVT